VSLSGQEIAEPRGPNIVLIISDDMGYADMPGFGERKEIPMPQMDRLREAGVTFTNAYVTGPICVPSRMGITTGRHQARWGAYENVHGGPALREFQAQKTIGRYFKERGYATALYGKWHLSGNIDAMENAPAGYLPDAHGFDDIEVIDGGMDSFWEGTRLYREGREYTEAPEYLTDHFGKLAADFIQDNRDKPFLLYLAFTAPHAPLHAPEEDIARFGPMDDYDQKHYASWKGLKEDERRPEMDRQVYAGMMHALDRNIGRVLDALEEAGLREDTLVVFINDNGGPALDAASFSYNMAANAPHRGNKYLTLEGGIRVPMVISGPGLPEGEEFTGLSSAMDILPTALAKAGIDPDTEDFDGVNLLPYLRGEKSGDPHDALFWRIEIPTRRVTSTHDSDAAMRAGPWKLYQQCPSGERPRVENWQLFNLDTDPGETTDLARQHPDVVRELDAKWQAWRDEMSN
jgi:arylsulfatase A-like enzyme